MPEADSIPLSSPTVGHSAPKACALCGLPLGRSRAHRAVNCETFSFCCPGCLHVFEILLNHPEGIPSNFRETDLYRACVQAEVIPRNEPDLVRRQGEIEETKESVSDNLSPDQVNEGESLTFKVEGMWCTACGWLIEEVLKRTEGVLGAQVFFVSDLAKIRYLPQSVSPQVLLGKVKDLGYRLSLFEEGAEASQERKDLLLRLGISSFLTANIMMISFALYMGFFQDLSAQAVTYLSYPLAVLATPVLFYGGFPILRRAASGLRHRAVSMDTLISVGALSAYLYSLVQMFRGSLHVYFDTASMLITLVLLGRYIEAQAKEKISRGVTELYQLARLKVRLRSRGRERWVTPEAVQSGDAFLVLAGEAVPIDGRLLGDRAHVDESILTGESRPVQKKMGDEVMAGSLLLDGRVELEVVRSGRESSLNRMITLMEEALAKKNPFELLADRIMGWFVPAVFTLALGAALFLWFTNTPVESALLRAVTVLVITCPCALGIASPLAKVASIGAARSKGILIRNPAALEGASGLDAILLDKTGTVTQGNFSLREIRAEGLPQEDALRWVASVEQASSHFLAREILRKAKEQSIDLEEVTGYEELDGYGVKGSIRGREISVGNRQLVEREKLGLPIYLEKEGNELESKGRTVIFFGWKGVVRGYLAFGDLLKSESPSVVKELKRRGHELWLVSGDGQGTTRAVAEELGIPLFRGQALPPDKVELIKTLQAGGHRVGMVGDGLNDAAALAQADVGFAFGTGANLAREASDITLLTADPLKLLQTLDLSRQTTRVIRQNLAFAFLYNALAIPLAVGGLLNPLLAVCAMFASSLSVIGNTLRISRDFSKRNSDEDVMTRRRPR